VIMGELNEEQKAALGIVAGKASLLSRLVDDIITLQYTREQIQLRPWPLPRWGVLHSAPHKSVRPKPRSHCAMRSPGICPPCSG